MREKEREGREIQVDELLKRVTLGKGNHRQLANIILSNDIRSQTIALLVESLLEF